MSEEQELSVEKSSLPVIGEKVEFHGQTYECVNVDWNRRDDEITAVYRNVDNEDPDYSQFAGHFLNNEPDKPTVNIVPDHPSARYQNFNPAGPDRFA